jgi:hypothetical protein
MAQCEQSVEGFAAPATYYPAECPPYSYMSLSYGCPEMLMDSSLASALLYQQGTFYGKSGQIFSYDCAPPCPASFTVCDFAPYGCARMPGAPSGPSPATGASLVSENAVLSWTAVPGASQYVVYFGPSFNPPAAATVSGTSYSPGSLQLSKKYWWKIRAVSHCGAMNISPLWDFTTRPPGITLTFEDASILVWEVEGDAAADLVRGTLSSLRTSGAATSLGAVNCLGNNSTAGTYPDAAVPPAGQAWFYLLRPPATSDYGRSSDGRRRQASSGDCPL